MKRIKFLLVGLSVVISASAFAQETPSKRGLGLSIGVDGALPIGTFHSTSKYQFGIGASAKIAIPVATNLDVTGKVGYMGFSGSKLNTVTDKNTFTIIPFEAGLRLRTNGGFYVAPEAGFTQTKASNTEGSGQFSYAFSIGYLIGNAVDISAAYHAISAKDQTVGGVTVSGVSAKFLGLRIAYNIPFARVNRKG